MRTAGGSKGTAASLLLSGDIGGTKTNLALFEERDGRLFRTDGERYEGREYSGLEEILEAFLPPRGVRLAAAAFGIAGPVRGGRSKATNLPWVVDAAKLSRRLRVPVAVVNDLEATAHAVPALRKDNLSVLHEGRPAREGSLALIAAGTGLGEAFVLRDGGRFLIGATEGGHADFAPRTEEEIALFRHLRERFGRVSVERVLSGPGLAAIYDFLRSREPGADPAVDGVGAATEGDRAAAISSAAAREVSPLAQRALRIFVSVYGAETGNLALRTLATGGVYLGGGIAPKILSALKQGEFVGSYLDKGRFRELLAAIPVKVILDDHAALLGAARIASALAGTALPRPPRAGLSG